MKKTILYATIATAVAAIAAMGVIGCNNGAGGGERVNSYLRRFDPPNSGDGGGTWTSIYTLETNVSPAGGGTVTRDPNNDTYEAGAQVTIVATAIDGYTFTGWTVTDGSVVDNAGSLSTYVIVNGNATVTANFTSDGTFTDVRDGKRYRKVTIGGKEWMAENLNYETGNSWCYDCGKYGRLYDWSTAMTACPAGWHLPSSAEWDALMTAVGGSSTAGKKLKSISGWYNNGNGTDEYGFSALPGGFRSSGGHFHNVGNSGYWWTATEGNAYNAWNRYMDYNYDYVYSDANDKSYGRSVRCVGD